jgi:hydroxymethylglutaryl-CoA synthase
MVCTYRLWRMDRKLIRMRGQKAIAYFDEDNLSMAVAVGMNCLNGSDRASVDKAFFASTTFPHREKQGAFFWAAACDFPHFIGSSDFSNSLKGASLFCSLPYMG